MSLVPQCFPTKCSASSTTAAHSEPRKVSAKVQPRQAVSDGVRGGAERGLPIFPGPECSHMARVFLGMRQRSEDERQEAPPVQRSAFRHNEKTRSIRRVCNSSVGNHEHEDFLVNLIDESNYQWVSSGSGDRNSDWAVGRESQGYPLEGDFEAAVEHAADLLLEECSAMRGHRGLLRGRRANDCHR